MTEEYKYDLFISYAREDHAWVKHYLHEPLLACILPDGKRPRIFLDNSELGIGAGENFIAALSEALQKTRRIIPVYSDHYFKKEMTLWELRKAFQLDPNGNKRLINPVLLSLSSEVQGKIPFEVNHIQYIDILKEPQWFERLRVNLDLAAQKQKLELKFLNTVPDTQVNLTLPEIKIALNNSGTGGGEEEIEITAKNAGLQGSLKKQTKEGVAVFSDLSCTTTCEKVTLKAMVTGYATVESNAFTVAPAPMLPRVEQGSKTVSVIEGTAERKDPDLIAIIAEEGVASGKYFQSGRSILLFTAENALVYDCLGKKLATVPVPEPLRLILADNCEIVLASWNGNVTLINDTGQWRSNGFRGSSGQFCIPADCSISSPYTVLGFWNGDIFRLGLAEEPVRIFNHPDGIQVLATFQTYIYFCDLKGVFHIVEDGKYLYSREIERTILKIELFGTRGILLVGEQAIYQLMFGRADIYQDDLNLSSIIFSLREGEYVTLLDRDGKGVRIDEELALQSQFYTTAGAKPICSEKKGQYSVFLYPDATRSLLFNDKIVYTHPFGIFCFDPTLEQIAMGTGKDVKLYKRPLLSKLSQVI